MRVLLEFFLHERLVINPEHVPNKISRNASLNVMLHNVTGYKFKKVGDEVAHIKQQK